MREPCKHAKRWYYDCGCTFGPPSCTTCKYNSECDKCGALLSQQPTEQEWKPVEVTR